MQNITKFKRSAKAKYYTEIFEHNVNDMKRTWQIIRKAINKQPTKSNITDTFIIGNNEITDKRKIANGFNNFFANIGTKTSDGVRQPPNKFTDYLTENHPTNFFMRPTNQDELIKVAKALKSSPSQGFDNFSMQIIKTTMHIYIIVAPLAHICNQSFLTGIVPDNMKIAKILPIYKSGNKKILNNYRPISLLPAFSKLLEKLVCNRLVHILETHNLLFKHQYGFRRKHSTIHPILQLLRHIKRE